MQAISGIHQAVGFAQGVQGFQMSDFKHRRGSMKKTCDECGEGEFVS